MTKSIVVVKMPCNIYIYISFLSQLIRNTYNSLSSWSSLISDVLVAYNLASD